MAKDLFSDHASLYARYRPGYPKELIEHIVSFTKERKAAWDCATGNGQAASMLAEYFQEVQATDLSESQLANAAHKPNIIYRQSPAESVPFDDDHFDLITVATAYHWLNWQKFHEEAYRVGKNGCVVAVWVYYTLYFNDETLDELYRHFYRDITNPYWEKERRFVDEKYETVLFDFDPLPVKEFESVLHWSRSDFKGYLETWSATQAFIRKNGHSPVDLISEQLEKLWPGDEKKAIHFPLSLRLGRIAK